MIQALILAVGWKWFCTERNTPPFLRACSQDLLFNIEQFIQWDRFTLQRLAQANDRMSDSKFTERCLYVSSPSA
jgi:hypothetical protein